ncbi:MAG TPA: hypothetical protein VHM90_00065, partial [Phycisphaerae bacterium]|nr:hypothetical protein [Phycisphaerae bacterium]
AFDAASRGAAGGAGALKQGRADPSRVVAMAAPAGAAMAYEPPMDPTASVASEAAAAELGELFQFTVHNISLPRQRSAMIPIVTDAIAAERLSIYNEHVLESNPLYGVKLTNNTGKHLLQGPVTVLEASAYAGDARIDNLPPNQHRYLSYGIDLQIIVRVTQKPQRTRIQTAAISKGVLELTEETVVTREYAVDNKARQPRALLIEYPVESGFTLISKPDPVESTTMHHRLRYDLAAGETRAIVIQARSIDTRRVALVEELAATLEKHIRSGNVPASVKAGLEEIIRRRRDISGLAVRISGVEKQITELTKEQSRIRDNLKTAPDSSQYHNRLLTKLNEQESLFEKLQLELENLRQTRDKANEEFAVHVAKLDLA